MLGAGYEIKITPPASEIELYVLGKKITQEQTIEPGASIEVKTGNNTGTFSFTVKEIKNTLTRNVNVSVTTNPEYATGLTIGTLDNASTEVEAGKTLKLVANVTPSTATEDVTWKVESGSATVDTAGTVTVKEDATAGSEIVVSAKLTRKDGTATTVGQKTITITVKQTSSGGSTGGTTITTEGTYIGYYADVDGDGTVDGIIYADLTKGGSGQWEDNDGTYTIPTVTEGLKEYTVSETKYEGKFGEKEVITAVKNSTGTERFYVMALEDFNKGTSYYWYNAAYNYGMSDYASTTSRDFGKGKDNTATMISKWNNSKYGTQNNNDMWGQIQTEVAKGWYVPSRAEWAAFASKLEITKSNYVNFSLSDGYWSSSQGDANRAWYAYFGNGFMGNYIVNGTNCVRLAATF